MSRVEVSARLEELLEWLASAQPCRNPAVEKKLRSLFLDTLGCLIAGARKPEVAALHRQLAVFESGPVHLPIGGAHAGGLGAGAAAVVTGVASCWDEACEGLARAHGRPGLHAFATALPMALARDATLEEVLDALAWGYEVGGRLGETLRIYPAMHVDGTWGTFAGVAAAARLLGLDRAACLRALQGAACQVPLSLYRPITAGATVRNLYVGAAAARALHHTLAVQAGLGSPADALDQLDRIFLAPSVWTGPDRWLVEEGYLKPYAAVRHVHYAAAAGCAWHRSARPGERIESARLVTYPEALTYCANTRPGSAIEAQFSLSYGLAHALLYGDLGPQAYDAARMQDAELRRVEGLVEVASDAAYGTRRGARLRVRSTAGESEEIEIDAVPGDRQCPLEEHEVAAKFSRYAAAAVGGEAAARVSQGILEASLDSRLRDVLRLP